MFQAFQHLPSAQVYRRRESPTRRYIFTINEIILSTQNGEPVASSRDVAERFGKEHKDVLRSIKNLTAQNCALLKMFHKTEYTTAQNKKATMYLMNRDGFSLLAMGFTGK